MACSTIMAKLPLHPNRTGMDIALDLVEETLATLKERAQRNNQLLQKNAETNTSLKSTGINVQTSTTNLLHESNSSNQRETSVLIKRKGNKRLDVSKGRQNASVSSQHKKNHNASSLKSGHSRKPSHSSKAPERQGMRESRGNRSNANSSLNRKHKRQIRSNSDGLSHRSLGRAQGTRRRSVTSDGEFLRGFEEPESHLLSDRRSKTWVPPLCQSSPRESTISTSRSDSEMLQHSSLSFQEVSNPSGHNSKDGLIKSRSTKSSHSQKVTVPLPTQNYAEPTLTSMMRVKLSEEKGRDEKENMTPFIPSGSTNKSHHVGVIMQQKIGLLKNIPPKELGVLTEPFNPTMPRTHGHDSDSSIPTEEAVRRALSNIQEHIAQVAKQTCKR